MARVSFDLKPLLEEDISAACRICGLAMRQDRHTMLKTVHPTKPYNHESGMVGAFEYWLSSGSSDTELIKAVDKTTGEMLGLVCWHKRLEQQEHHEQDRNSESEREKPAVVVSKNYTRSSTQTLDPLEELNEVTSSHLAAYQRRIMPSGVRCMYIGTLAVDPAYQKLGIGSALIRHGTDRADQEGVICWVHSSDGAEDMYRKHGFEPDDVLTINLDDWAGKMDIKPPKGETRWGPYSFTYMVRQQASAV